MKNLGYIRLKVVFPDDRKNKVLVSVLHCLNKITRL